MFLVVDMIYTSFVYWTNHQLYWFVEMAAPP